ncbi:ATP synthase subunit A [Sorangium cellulosum]|uniref:ATP synthase subunit a n=2 Tax=Sorangium cellulosum TaxID=56 RepID=A0A150QB93_SORCE|nr:F0F1 ATP synthase subunit A [Sorangium cellulosum]AGP41169.1 ATP synthase subunit A [Sorangium cellulosum So0157-2]KYF64868.1 ATP synthase subunit A [Sorangium cellulosum]
MPEHTGFLTYLLAQLPGLRENARNIGKTFIGHHTVDYRGTEPIFMSLLIMVLFVLLASEVRGQYRRLNESVVPEDKLTLRTFFEAFFGYFYGMARDVMGPENAKRYFPLIGGSAAFIFFSNASALIPGVNPPTSNLNVTIGCAVVVFILFNYYGLKENGWGYIAHLAGPKWYLAPLIFPIEVISTCVRPVTLSIRLMLNIGVDHLVASIFLGLIALFVPVPLMFLAIIVIVVQTLVFCLLSCIYIGLATEKADHHH